MYYLSITKLNLFCHQIPRIQTSLTGPQFLKLDLCRIQRMPINCHWLMFLNILFIHQLQFVFLILESVWVLFSSMPHGQALGLCYHLSYPCDLYIFSKLLLELKKNLFNSVFGKNFLHGTWYKTIKEQQFLAYFSLWSEQPLMTVVQIYRFIGGGGTVMV